MMGVVAGALLALGLFLLWLARRGRARSGLPQGKIVYVDTGGWQRTEEPLFSARYRLTGRPDYLVTQGRAVIPVEVKSGRTPTQPYPGHILQLAAYCLLVEENFHRRPAYGLIHYPQRTFAVEYTPALKRELLATMARMRRALAAGGAGRSHDHPARCRGCGYRQWCAESLTDR